MLAVDAVSKVYEPPPAWLRPLVRTAVRQPVEALRQVSLSVDRGEIIGLVGPNGAGKTTLIKVITTLLEPTSGRVSVDGLDASRQAGQVRSRLGVVLEGDQGLYDRLSGQQNLELYGRLAGMGRAAALARAHELLEMLELARRDKLVFGYSAGMKMRLSIARAMMADPPFLVLDEPTRSLDPVASRFTMRLFRQLADGDRAILLSNHRLDEVVAVCTRIVAIVHGRVCFFGTPGELGQSAGEAALALSDLLEHEAVRPR
jgi:ABC-2 type transport system ATP-binding protein